MQRSNNNSKVKSPSSPASSTQRRVQEYLD